MTSRATVIEAGRGSVLAEARDLWQYRELLGFMAWRDIRVRYAQTFVGAAWALIEPFITVLAFTIVFHNIAGLESGEIPYPLYCFAAMLLWSFFARALRNITTSFVTNAAVVRKIYFPRLILPCSILMATCVDFACASLMYFVLMAYYGIAPPLSVLTMPLWVLLAALNALGVGLVLCAVNVRFRDITQAIPFVIQIWMLATPIAYPMSSIPKAWLPIFQLNPMVGAVEGMRWALLPGQTLNPALVLSSVLIGLVLLIGGWLYFRYAQHTFADVI